MADNRSVVIALQGHGARVERAVGAAIARLAQETARNMKRLAPKWRSTLTNSIAANKTGDMAWEIGAHTDYAANVEDGIKPGGKGLPRFFDPAAKSIVDWLESKAYGGQRKPRAKLTKMYRELELRDRYEGLAWHIRRFGTRAQPFVKPAFDELEAKAPERVAAAVRAVLARGGAGAAA